MTAIDEIAGADAETVSEADPLTLPMLAVIVVDPASTALAIPEALTVAIPVLAAAQLTLDVTFAVDALLYVAVAVNCSVAPVAMLAEVGVMAIVLRVGGGAVPVAEPQPATARTRGSRHKARRNGVRG